MYSLLFVNPAQTLTGLQFKNQANPAPDEFENLETGAQTKCRMHYRMAKIYNHLQNVHTSNDVFATWNSKHQG